MNPKNVAIDVLPKALRQFRTNVKGVEKFGIVPRNVIGL
jgi:hypothetical protein